MTQPVYRSTDASAPTLGNNNGDLVSVLDAILVNGYGAKSALGWSIAFTGTNKRVYQQGAGSNGFQLRVDDANNVYEARVRGAEAFSDVDTISSGGFPTAAQQTNGLFWQKTNNTAGNRAWVAWGDAKRFIMLIDVTGAGAYNALFFGDLFSFKSGDAYHTLLIGKTSSAASSGNDNFGTLGSSGTLSAATAGHYLARSYSGAGSAIQANKYIDTSRHTSASMGQGSAGSNTLTYPDPISGSLQLSRVFIGEPTAAAPRGYIPGLWAPCHNAGSMAGVANADTFSGTDGLVSKTFEFRTANVNGGNDGAMAIETSDWAES